MAYWNQFHWNAGAFWGDATAGAPSLATSNKPRRILSMKRTDYFPRVRGEQPEWLLNFAMKLLSYAGAVGYDPVIAAARANDCRYEAYYIADVGTAVRDHGKAYTSSVDQLAHGVGPFVSPSFVLPPLPVGVTLVACGALDRVFAFVQLIKALPAYTETIGIDMGIVGAEFVETHLVPEFSLKSIQGPVCHCGQINFKKYSHMAVIVEGRVNDGAYAMLGIVTDSPYLDARPLLIATQSEVREYRLRFWDNGAGVGECVAPRTAGCDRCWLRLYPV